MNLIKRIISIICTFILITGMGGCMNEEEKDNKKIKEQEANGPEEIKDQIIGFLEKKYGKEFVPLSLEIDRWPYHWDDLSAYPKGGDKEKDSFCAYRQEKDGKYVFSDTYFGLIVHDEYEQKVKEIANKYFPQNKTMVIFGSDIFPNELGINSTLKDLIDMNVNYDPKLEVVVVPTFKNIEQFDKQVDLFMKEITDNKLRGIALTFYLKGYDLDVDITFDESSYQRRREIYIRPDFTLSEQRRSGQNAQRRTIN
eukprot:TRINITY_DN2586_c0_g1_i1.p2 TRINITY_DN2586_c0_g1~~TRINITY_DN2586_c0_g1_i1.p2  ORF type:complete len:254 (+),score=40.59 TRINITY_DN2586_c0_g1_i1:525-1286(+)